MIVTASGGVRGTKVVPLKSIVDSAVDICRKAGFQVLRPFWRPFFLMRYRQLVLPGVHTIWCVHLCEAMQAIF